MGGYGDFQDHDLIMAHMGPVAFFIGPRTAAPFSVGTDPIGRASQVVSGLLFMRRDVSPAVHTVNMEIRPQDLFTPANASGALPRDQSRIQLVTRFGITYTGSKPPEGVARVTGAIPLHLSGSARVIATDWAASVVDSSDDTFNTDLFFAGLRRQGILTASNRTDASRGQYETENGQLFLDATNRILTLRTPRAEGVCDARFASPHRLGALTVQASSKPAGVAALSLDGKPLAESGRILLVYATDALNSGARFDNEERCVMRDRGASPVLMQCGQLSVSLKHARASALSVWALGFDGARRNRIAPETVSGDVLTLRIDMASLPDGPTPFFELAEQ